MHKSVYESFSHASECTSRRKWFVSGFYFFYHFGFESSAVAPV